MARLFTALLPSAEALADLAERITALRSELPWLRWSSPEQWHITLGFFGDEDDPRRRTRWLLRRSSGLPAPAMALDGYGTFPGVLWVGARAVSTDDERTLNRVARAAGAGRRGFHPHLTVARWKTGRDRPPGEPLGDYTGPEFTTPEIVLICSELGAAGPKYSVVERVPLVS